MKKITIVESSNLTKFFTKSKSSKEYNIFRESAEEILWSDVYYVISDYDLFGEVNSKFKDGDVLVGFYWLPDDYIYMRIQKKHFKNLASFENEIIEAINLDISKKAKDEASSIMFNLMDIATLKETARNKGYKLVKIDK